MSTAMAGPRTQVQAPGETLVRISVEEVRSRIYGNPRMWRALLHLPYKAGPQGDTCAGSWHHAGDSCRRCCKVIGTVRGHATADAAVAAAIKLAKRRGLTVRRDRISDRGDRLRPAAAISPASPNATVRK